MVELLRVKVVITG